MSRPRSRSPHYRRFPWDEPDFDPYKVVAELGGDQMDRRHHHHPRGTPEERWNYVREDMHPEDQRRSSPFQDDRQFGHQRHSNQEEFYRRRPSPQHDMLGYEERRLSPIHDGGEDGARRIGGFREAYPNFENSGRSPNSPPRFKRERLPLTPRSDSDHQQREPGGWRREGQGRGRGRFRDPSPSARSDDQRGGTGRERGRRNTQSLIRERQWEDPHQERNPHFKRQRREMDDTNNSGYRNEEHFGEQRHSMDSPRDGFQRERQGNLPRGDGRHSGPLIIEHDHGITDRRDPSPWEKFEDRRDLDPGLDRQRSPCPTGFSQERFRASESRLQDRDTRPHFLQDNRRDSSYHGSARTPEKRPSPVNYGSRDSTMNHRGRGAFRPARGRASRGQFGRTGLPRNQPHLQHSFQVDQDNRNEGPRQRSQPFRGDYEDPIKQEPNWAEEDGPPGWKADRSGSLDRSPVTIDLDPKMPRQRLREWNKQKTKNMAVAEETLTIKVDMSQPVNKNSLLCYSSDRQLSLDLVNVGRQRLDFLPMLEHSGTYRETAVHTGTFAQEIITLVHSVKELYFRGDGVTLNERFSAPQKGGYLEEETEELTLDERFSSNRGFSLNMNSLLDDNEPLFSRLGSLPPARGPGDLRHDLERRRQERLEGVKVTILGNNLSQSPQGPVSEPGAEYNDDEDQLEDEEFLDWPEEQSRSREGNMGTRRGAPFRQNNGPQRKNNRFGSRLGQIRRQNYRNSPAGPSW
uniref:BCLAF1 and THRAP3 family member 3-like n=2 Tax=Labrus bergylta TaxID=56723 RepID=A0A3Q3FDE3_9LABR|nr:BCLAF1 and THRAP3 family member 3-like isoform X1 [Labrus bergylta]